MALGPLISHFSTLAFSFSICQRRGRAFSPVTSQVCDWDSGEMIDGEISWIVKSVRHVQEFIWIMIVWVLQPDLQGYKRRWTLAIIRMKILTWQMRKMGQDKVGGSCQVNDKAETNDCISPSGLLVSLSFLWLRHILTIWRVITISCQERSWNNEKRIIWLPLWVLVR